MTTTCTTTTWRARPLAHHWGAALVVALAVFRLASWGPAEHPSVDPLPVDSDWIQEAIGPIAYPPQVDRATPVWKAWLPLPATALGPEAPAAGRDGLVFHAIAVTGYSSRIEETDSDPFITASNTETAPGVLALSRDLLRTFTPGAPFDFGDRVLVAGVGVYQVEDTMHPRWTRRADVWFPSTEEALAWGRRETYLARVEVDTPIDPFEMPLAMLTQEPIDLRHQAGLSTPWRILQ